MWWRGLDEAMMTREASHATMMLWGLVSLVMFAALSVPSGVEGFEVGRFKESEAAIICEENSVSAVSCEAGNSLDGLFAHPDDCRLFYQCAYGVPACAACPPGLHFNPALRVCDQPERAGCDPALLSPSEPGESNGNDIPQRCIDNSVTAVSCANTPAPDALVAHPDDCQLFYYCVSAHAAPVCRQCPAGLHFNPEKRVCDNPQDAGCIAAIPPPPIETFDEKRSVFIQT